MNMRPNLAICLLLIATSLVPCEAGDDYQVPGWSVVGVWQQNYGIDVQVVIEQSGTDYRVRWVPSADKTSTKNTAQLQKTGNTYRRVDSSTGDYNKILSDGSLSSYDNEGYIDTLKAVRRPANSGTNDRSDCPVSTLFATSRVNIRSGPGLDRTVVRKASPGERLSCDYMQDSWYHLASPSEEWIHKSVVADSPPAPANESCYQLGVRYGRCATMAMMGKTCAPADDIVKPQRCKGDAKFDRGLAAGVEATAK